MKIRMCLLFLACLGATSPILPDFVSSAEAAPTSDRERLDAIIAKIEADNPDRPKVPGPPEEAAAYAAFIVGERTSVPEDQEFLRTLKGGKVDGVSDKQLDTFIYRRGYMLERQLERNLTELQASVDGNLRSYRDRMSWFRDLDVNDENKQRNLVLKEGAMEKQFGYFNSAEEALALSRAFYEASGEQGPDFAAVEKEVADTRAHFQKLADNALALVKMPPDIGNAELTAVAREVLSKEKYGVSPIRALSVVRGVTNGSRERVDTRKGQLVVYDYQWQEFTVATAEEVEPGTLFIHWNTIKKFTSGSPTTPTDSWVLGERFKSSRIPASNL